MFRDATPPGEETFSSSTASLVAPPTAPLDIGPPLSEPLISRFVLEALGLISDDTNCTRTHVPNHRDYPHAPTRLQSTDRIASPETLLLECLVIAEGRKETSDCSR